ncbi:MAG TPA: GntG family PLP-dependent aldolase [Thermoanaerobaculia bacterium]|nr:GntG family PLP-dependent aldolase [Thermoanaerobaculia bacterium]
MSAAPIDLRSDTVTRPDEEMRRAMAEAEVGDDVFAEDPTVQRLEEEAAAAVGMEAALFVPSGTMGNQVALHLHGRPGGEVICDSMCHIVNYEIGAMAAVSGLLPRVLVSPGGLLDPAAVEAAIAPDLSYRAPTVLIEVENSHNMAGGTVYDRPHLESILKVARRHGLPVHLDGARIFNAALALGTTVPALAAGFDSLMYCLSKGLGAPVGSLICGRRDFVAKARRVRKMLGGGMRQVGVLAAAGLVALRKGPARLPEDHENASRLARALAGMEGIELDLATVRTNIVIFRLAPGFCEGSSATFLARLKEAGVLGSLVSRDQVRLVTHRDVNRGQIDQAITAVRGLSRPGTPA